MADSLRDQLLKAGFVAPVREEKRAPAPRPQTGSPANKNAPANRKTQGGGPGPRKWQGGASQAKSGQGGKPQRPQQAAAPRKDGEIDLAKAYAIRSQTEAAERKRVEQEAAELAQLRKERKRKLEQVLNGKALNKPDVDKVRHFPYGDKIRRVHVDEAQLAALNAGELGVVQHGGRYLLLDRSVVEQIREFAPEQIALVVDPNAVVEADDGVPDDLMW
ncbi:uncharacterized protein YaiL (DUF2058 family) [Luteibacter rhizovicinus]|uniref:Uncharacterized protein YaiL (DUF2058 family) n=1 Tax=Luteibacter rhizovicinus TaxID=242606 RepID=A0A4R3Z165_9GAMM|nr:DUF2058 family protein [Luteibacter rhizovicinus]TCV97493.1 uncharacterized protein YaiL (DUF2058 family) [Luteibacter rhizovicinus]